MTDDYEAAQRLAALKPSDILAMDDESTTKLVADLARIGTGVSVGKVADDPQKAREVASKPKYWAGVLVAANRILRGEELRPAPPRPAKRQPATQRERLAAVADLGQCGITASECNEFLRSLPPIPLYGEPGCPFNPARFEIGNSVSHLHGSPYDRGWADFYYRRDRSPHKWGDPCGMERIEAMTDAEVAEYHAGYDEAERLDERKD